MVNVVRRWGYHLEALLVKLVFSYVCKKAKVSLSLVGTTASLDLDSQVFDAAVSVGVFSSGDSYISLVTAGLLIPSPAVHLPRDTQTLVCTSHLVLSLLRLVTTMQVAAFTDVWAVCDSTSRQVTTKRTTSTKAQGHDSTNRVWSGTTAISFLNQQ